MVLWGAVVMWECSGNVGCSCEWECSGNVGCSGNVWVQRGCGVMYEAMVMWDDGWGDSG